MEDSNNDIQISALTIGNNLTTRDVVSKDIRIDGNSIRSKLENIDAIYGQRLVFDIGGKRYMFFGREIESA